MDSSKKFLSVTKENIQQFSQGHFHDVLEDIEALLAPPHTNTAAQILYRDISLDAAFNCRREMIALKKVMQRMSEMSQQQEKILSRLSTWQYRTIDLNTDESAAAAAGSDGEVRKWVLSKEYEECSDALQLSRGLSHSLVEARGLMKSICSISRWPDAQGIKNCPSTSSALQYIKSMPIGKVWWNALRDASAFMLSVGESACEKWEDWVRWDGDEEKYMSGWESIRLLRNRIKDTISESAAEGVVCSFVARGGWKSCEMRYRASVYAARLSRLGEALNRAYNILTALVSNVEAGDSAFSLLRTHGKKHLLRLRSAACVVSELSLWVREILTRTHQRSHGTERVMAYDAVFVAGDSTLSSGAGHRATMQTMFYPVTFTRLPGLLNETANDILALTPTFLNSVEGSQWPPRADASRPSVEGSCQCIGCGGSFSRVWMDLWIGNKKGGNERNGVCCECVRRHKSATSSCSHDLLRALQPSSVKQRAGCKDFFCSHELYCPVHDGVSRAAFSCDACRLHRGDGSDLLQLCIRLSAGCDGVILFLDFDRTLCTSRAGADPCPPVDIGAAASQKQKHIVDEELRAVLHDASLRLRYICTRNRHGESIRQFLSKNDCPVDGIHIVAKKSNKSRVDVLTDNNTAPSIVWEETKFKGSVASRVLSENLNCVGILVDDDIAELSDSTAKSPENLHRFLFCRCAL